ncbi:MAG: (p)ppGpp synthetase [Candidatus Synechococcus spongiarum SP3]|uniref:(P)ppGpp synthetase n=1 Tax=Candidatus Synechococcus spongiarum SP3 TaxID=1604020 RepID=A0A0G2HM91_9SYNE|nr:MAG: (p)ppGpp synthetase [Candidatus Synechococcus spongiarum SP3]
MLETSSPSVLSGCDPQGRGEVVARPGEWLQQHYGIPLPAWLVDCFQEASPTEQRHQDPPKGPALIAAAFDFAWQQHQGQQRASGEPYICHPLAVADLLRDIGVGPGVIAAGFLHDVVEDCGVTTVDVEARFGCEVRDLVNGVTKLGGIHFVNRTEEQAENLRRMFLAMASDIRVVLVKLADRLHNMRTLTALPSAKQKRISIETLEIYAPLANRLGIGKLKWELEDLSFKVLHPQEFRHISQQLAIKRSEREARLNATMELLCQRLSEAGLTQVDVNGRPKHLYGIWNKMKRQNKAFHEIYDVAALRVLTESLENCYRALAVVHDTFRPIPGRFKDYIGLPKPNGYQSLHTAVIANQRPLEVQIRTQQMHQVAEYGIAAHWKYKEGGSPASGQAEERFNWLRQLLNWQQEAADGDGQDYLASIKDDLFDDEVFVFTPKGDVLGLRRGSTPVDFAYRIHSEVGHHCHGARINDRLTPLSTSLKNGDIVEIITERNARPSLDWLNFVATPTARNRIRQWYKASHRDQNINRGRDMLEHELGRHGLEELLRSSATQKVVERCNLYTVNDLLAAVGFGALTIHQVANRLREEIRLQSHHGSQPQPDPAATPAPSSRELSATADQLRGHPILGVDGLDFRLAGCCTPLPQEPIVGAVSLGNHGLTIHRQDCDNVERVPVERRLPVQWNPRHPEDNTYPVRLKIDVMDRVGVLKDILTRLSDANINVLDARVRTSRGKPARIDLIVELRSAQQLTQTVDRIRAMADVLTLYRAGMG